MVLFTVGQTGQMKTLPRRGDISFVMVDDRGTDTGQREWVRIIIVATAFRSGHSTSVCVERCGSLIRMKLLGSD